MQRHIWNRYNYQQMRTVPNKFGAFALGMLPVNRLSDYPVLEAWPVLKLPVRLTAQ